jgi:ABC-type microcin C transport system permease subunit YejE
VACGIILLLIVSSALAAPWLGLPDPYKTSMIRRLYPIGSPNFLLGTDELGRDMLARLIYGGRLSLFMGVTPVVLALLIGGSILIETVFAWPGTGFLLNSAIFRRDLPILQGTTLVLAGFFMLLNLTVDVIQTMVDPRIKRG